MKILRASIFVYIMVISGLCSFTQLGIRTGAEQTVKYLPLLKGKRVAVVANPASVIWETSLIDSLKSLKIDIVKIFGHEHGFRGTASAGAIVSDSIDAKTGIREISLYGKKANRRKLT